MKIVQQRGFIGAEVAAGHRAEDNESDVHRDEGVLLNTPKGRFVSPWQESRVSAT